MKTSLALTALACAALTVLTPVAARAYVISSNPNVPPGVPGAGNLGYYLTGTAHPFFNFGGAVTVSYDSFLFRPLDPITRTPQGADERASFSANMDSVGDVFVAPATFANDLASTASGIGDVITLGKIGNTTGTFSTEMLAMNLSGATGLGPYMMRESPTIASLGQTTVTDIGGGLYRIDSFFDIFTELSIDGGATWAPDSNGPVRMTLLPEPGAAALAALAGLLLARRRRA